MNNLLNRIAIALIISMVSLTSIHAYNGIEATITEGSVVELEFDDIKSGVADVKLIDAEGTQLWSERIKGRTTFHKQLNLRQLPDGRYKVIMTDGNLVHAQSITKSLGEIFVTERSVISILKPELTLNNNRLKITFPEATTKLTSVAFQAADGTSFFSDEVSYTSDFAKSYNLRKLAPGTYTVILTTDQDTYYKEVKVKN